MKIAVVPDVAQPNRERIADWVYGALRRAIARHELKPGTHLSVPALAERFGVSRSPVREAVQRVVQEGLAMERPHRGAFVTEFSPPELEPLYEVRRSLEGLVARLAAERMTESELQDIDTILEEQERAIRRGDMESHIDRDISFHAAMLKAARNPVLQEMLGRLYGRIRSAMLGRASTTGPDLALKDHRAIFKAIAARDPDAADKAAQRHVSHVLLRLGARKNAKRRGGLDEKMVQSPGGAVRRRHVVV